MNGLKQTVPKTRHCLIWQLALPSLHHPPERATYGTYVIITFLKLFSGIKAQNPSTLSFAP